MKLLVINVCADIKPQEDQSWVNLNRKNEVILVAGQCMIKSKNRQTNLQLMSCSFNNNPHSKIKYNIGNKCSNYDRRKNSVNQRASWFSHVSLTPVIHTIHLFPEDRQIRETGNGQFWSFIINVSYLTSFFKLAINNFQQKISRYNIIRC